MRLALPGPPHPPDKICQPEADQKPGGDLAARRLHTLEPGHGDAQGDAQKAQDDRAQDVPQPGQEGDAERFPERPTPRPADDDEGEVVVRADDGMDEPERRGRAGQDPDLPIDHHGSSRSGSPGDGVKKMVDGRRLELPTSALRTPRSPN